MSSITGIILICFFIFIIYRYERYVTNKAQRKHKRAKEYWSYRPETLSEQYRKTNNRMNDKEKEEQLKKAFMGAFEEWQKTEGGKGISFHTPSNDPYTILSVHPNAPKEVIDAAYHALAKKYHPDSGTKESNEEEMKKINEAYRQIRK